VADPIPNDEPSFLANTVGGGGCGCGCLGGMTAMVGAIVMIGIPLSFYETTSIGSMMATGVSLVVVGILAIGLGVVAYIGSLFIP
jgi:hypothetical protein